MQLLSSLVLVHMADMRSGRPLRMPTSIEEVKSSYKVKNFLKLDGKALVTILFLVARFRVAARGKIGR